MPDPQPRPDPKQLSGTRAAEFIEDGMTVGLGTGSTVHFTLLRLAERIRVENIRVRGVPTSLDTERKARELAIPLATLDEVTRIDLTIDGADEIDPDFNMIKGGGGALLREKVVASISAREVIVVGESKLMAKLGTSFALPLEVVPFALPVVSRAVVALGAEARERMRDGKPFRTDNGNAILDCRFARGIDDAQALELMLHRIPGLVETGLFIGLAHVLVIGRADGSVEVRTKGVR